MYFSFSLSLLFFIVFGALRECGGVNCSLEAGKLLSGA